MDLHPGELQTFINNSQRTHSKFYEDNWLTRMELVNRRCVPSDPDDWCKRSNIRKEVWNSDYKPLRELLDSQIAQSNEWVRTASMVWNTSLDGWGHLCKKIERGDIPCIP
jgi:hypothetical protein